MAKVDRPCGFRLRCGPGTGSSLRPGSPPESATSCCLRQTVTSLGRARMSASIADQRHCGTRPSSPRAILDSVEVGQGEGRAVPRAPAKTLHQTKEVEAASRGG